MDTPTYQKKINDYFSATCVQMALQLAKDVGILNILYAAKEPLTSTEIAEQGDLKERYVREILGSLATAEVLHVDETSTKFHIPEHHKGVLRRVTAFAKLAHVMGPRVEVMKEILTKDGPDGTRFHPDLFSTLEEMRNLQQDSIIDNDILASVPDIKEQLEKGIHAAEFGCAQGIILINLATRYPNSTFVGSDISETCIETARKTVAERGLTNITFEVYDLFELPESISNTFDWVFVHNCIHDLPYPVKALEGLKQVLKKDGTASVVEIGMPGTMVERKGEMFWARMYALSTFFCIPESFQRQGSNALGACWGVAKARKLIAEAGFNLVKEERCAKNVGNVHYLCKY